MKRFAVLGTKPGWHCERTIAAFKRRGAEAEFVTVETLVAPLGLPEAKAPLAEYDGLLIRGIPGGSLEQVIYRMDALHVLERGGLKCVNPPKTIEKTVDKFLTSALLEQAGLPVPPTICCEDRQAAQAAFFMLGEDVVYKPLFGSCGNGLLRLKSVGEAERAFGEIEEAGGVFYLQKFIPSGNSDIRAFVVGGHVIAAMRRTGSDWFANVSKGGRAQAYVLTAYEEELALAAAAVVQADVAGVDLLAAESGETFVTEVNGCPGWQGLSSVTDADIPDEIVSLFFD
jgi:RimK family alpha-L-glutamate ligase